MTPLGRGFLLRCLFALALCGIEAAAGTAAGAPAAAAAGTIAITGGTLIDGNGGRPIENATVLIQGERIAAVGPAGTLVIPADAKRIDAAGKFVLPGFIDLHVHLVYPRDGRQPIKLSPPYTQEEVSAAVDEAKIHLMRVTSHGGGFSDSEPPEMTCRAVLAGVQCIEHLYMPVADLDLIAERKIQIVPTLQIMKLLHESHGVIPTMEYLEHQRGWSMAMHEDLFREARKRHIVMGIGTGAVVELMAHYPTETSADSGLPLRKPFNQFGLGTGGRAHAPDEHYLVESNTPKVAGLREAAKAHAEFLYEMASGKKS
jgi:hypothetical protein